MKRLFVMAVAVALTGVVAQARGLSDKKAQDKDCTSVAPQIALKAANKAYGANESRNIVASKALYEGPLLKTYVVALSDEVEPSDWIVVLDGNCKLKLVGVAREGSSLANLK